MAYLPINLRDALITDFRWKICDKMGFIPFPHQAAWWAASNGKILTDETAGPDEESYRVRLADGGVVDRRVLDRPGGHARVIADLGAFKSGKSKSGGMWASAFACIPDARVQLIGLEYDICSPEFEYIIEALLSEAGLGLKYSSLQNRPRDGRMHLDLPNGARFEARSWERKDSLKGKEIDCYLICEGYQLPGLEVYTDYSQNLEKRSGYWVMPTTPDRPWVQAVHDRGHDDPDFPDWFCICGAEREQNPYTFNQRAMDRDDPEQGGLMTKEKFEIAYKGKLGSYVGRVYNYQRGQRIFTRTTAPDIWDPSNRKEELESIRIPPGWVVVAGADTGTYTSAGVVAFDPNDTAYVLAEFPNYTYMADGKPDLLDHMSISVWARWVVNARKPLDGRADFWADSNSQWRHELAHYGIALKGNNATREARTSVARAYFHNDRIFLAPWLKVLPFELENARWPDQTTSSGRFERVKDRDHTLDWLEHVLSQRPLTTTTEAPSFNSFIAQQLSTMGGRVSQPDPHNC